MANTVIYTLAVTIVAWGWSIWLVPLNADASSENGLIYYDNASRLPVEANQKYDHQLIENTDTNKHKQEQQPVADTTDKISAGRIMNEG